MFVFNKGVRIVQSKNSKAKNEYIVTGTEVKEPISINLKGKKTIEKFNMLLINHKPTDYLIRKYNDFFKTLIDEKVLIETLQYGDSSKVFISNKECKLPLSCLNIELTDGCNLKCVHCYNDFGNRKVNFINKNNIFQLIDEMNKLNTYSISFTGGECTLHPDFIEIVSFFVEYGFNVTIFTNGFNYKKIIDLITIYPNVKFNFKISLDSYKEKHNYIRGNTQSYDHTILLLDYLSKQEQIDVSISSIIMKSNIKYAMEFENFIKNKYPLLKYSADLITPTLWNHNECFSVEDFDDIKNIYPAVFHKETKNKKRIFRCSGGISQATLMVDGKMKICNGACAAIFEFELNVFNVGLEKTWIDCGVNVACYRREKRYKLEKCKNCSYNSKCLTTNCRVIAYAYTGDAKNNNPMTCYTTKNM